MGEPEWAQDPRWDTFEGRKKDEETLEKRIGNWTKQFTAEEVMKRLQEAGVQAGVVQNAGDLYGDPQLIHRKHFVPVLHPDLGEYDYFSSGFRLEKTPSVKTHAPCLGEHNEYVYKQVLGMSDEEVDQHQKSGALT